MIDNDKKAIVLEISKKILDLFEHCGYVRGKITFSVDVSKNRCLGELHRTTRVQEDNIETETHTKEYL